MRILLLHNIVNPHMTPVFEALSRADGVELTVAYFAESEADRTWSSGAPATFRSVILPGRQLNLLLRWDTLSFHFNPGLGAFLRDARYDVLINAGWMSISNWHAFVDCRRRGRGHVLWAGSTRNEPSIQRTLTAPLVRYMVRHSDAYVSYGSASSAYLRDLGARASHVVAGYHCIDNQRFLSLCERVRPTIAAERAALELTGRKVVLFVGRMLERKGGDHLIDACARLCAKRHDVALLMVGDGPLRSAWEARAARALPKDAYRFVGNQPLERLPLFYQLADVFVLPSLEEVWGLVLNEAELAGLPVVASDRCGATADLVEDGVNGYRFPAGDVAALVAALRHVLGDDDGARAMGRESRRVVERCTPAKVADALRRAAELARRN